MTIGISFHEESESESSKGVKPPPLPASFPPVLTVARPPSQTASSYYVPSDHPDSADEASDIDEDPKSLKGRAKSADRDSDFSESVTTKSSKPLSSSYDSLADSGMGTMRQPHRDATSQKLQQLEKLLKVSWV